METRKPAPPTSAKPAARSRRKLDTLEEEDTFQTRLFELVCGELRERGHVAEVENEARLGYTRRAVSEAILMALVEEGDARRELIDVERSSRWIRWGAAAASCHALEGYLEEAEDTSVAERRGRSRIAVLHTSSRIDAAQRSLTRISRGLSCRVGMWMLLEERRRYRPHVPIVLPPLSSIEISEGIAREAVVEGIHNALLDLTTSWQVDRNYWQEVQNRRNIRRGQQLAFETIRADEFISHQWISALSKQQDTLDHLLPHVNDPDHLARIITIQRWAVCRRSKVNKRDASVHTLSGKPTSAHDYYAGMRRLEAVVSDRASCTLSDSEYLVNDEERRLLAAHALAAQHTWKAYVRMVDRAADYYFAEARWKIPTSRHVETGPHDHPIVSNSLTVAASGTYLTALLADEVLQRRYVVEAEEAEARGRMSLSRYEDVPTVRSKARYIQDRLLEEDIQRNRRASVVPIPTVHQGIALGVKQYHALLKEAGPIVLLPTLVDRETTSRDAFISYEVAMRDRMEKVYFRDVVAPRNTADSKWLVRMEHVRRHRLEVGAGKEHNTLLQHGKFINHRSHIEVMECMRRNDIVPSLLSQHIALLGMIREEIQLIRSLQPERDLRLLIREFEVDVEPEPILADRVAFVNCVFAPKGLVCSPGSDLLAAAHVLLKCKLLSISEGGASTVLSTSCMSMEFVREFNATRRMSVSGTFVSESQADNEDTLAILRPRYIADAKSEFCEMVRDEEKDALGSSPMSTSARDAAVAKALRRRLNSMEYVYHLQSEHTKHGNLITPEQLATTTGDLVLRYTLELSGSADGRGGTVEVMVSDVELPKVGASPSALPSEDCWAGDTKPSSWDAWWCVSGNPNPILTETTCIDGTSNTKLQTRSVFGTLSYGMQVTGQPIQRRPSSLFGSSLHGLQGGQVCINIGRVQGGQSRPPSSSTGGDEEEDDMDRGGDFGWGMEEDEAPTPFYLHIGTITVDKTLMEQTLGSAETYHNYRRASSLEQSMSWKRGTNASIRLVVDPHFPGLPQALYIPVEPLEGPGGVSKFPNRAIMVPEYVRRAEERYISLHSNDDNKLYLEEHERLSPSFVEYMAAEHEKQQWKVPIKKSFGELKFNATLQLQGSGSRPGSSNQTQTLQVPLMSQGVRYLDMQACFKAMNVYAHRVATRSQAVQEDGAGPNIKQPTVRASLLSLKHSFTDASSLGEGTAIASSDRSEITLVGNVLQFARSDLLTMSADNTL